MNDEERKLLARLQETFLVEAREHLEAISASLAELERSSGAGPDDAALEVIFRSAHSLKGGARIVNFSLIEFLCQAFEECLAALRRGAATLDRPLIGLMYEVVDVVEQIIHLPSPESPGTALKGAALGLATRLTGSLRQESALPDFQRVAPEPVVAAVPSSEPVVTTEPQQPFALSSSGKTAVTVDSPRLSAVDSVRIPASRLDSLLLQAEEMISLKLTLRQHASGIREVLDSLELLRREFSAEGELSKRSPLELDNALRGLGKRLALLKRSCEEDVRQAGGMVDGLIQDAKSLLMFPFGSLTGGLRKLIRETAREQGKEIEFKPSGETVELDRRILQALKDPLVHIIRNCIDHGIETPAERAAAGKTAGASIGISAAYIENGKAQITISDNGRGIDINAVKEAAVRQGLLTAEEAAALPQEEALRLIFRSGLSSRSTVTTVSGRGLGLAIVAEHVENLGGTVNVESGTYGTLFRLVIPLSLATFRGIRIRVGASHFAVPTLNVHKVSRLPESGVGTVGNRETVVIDGQTVPVVPLAGILGVPRSAASDDFRTVMVLGTGQNAMAFELDEVIGEDDLLAKTLGPQLVRVRNISGATVLGNGRVIPILNVKDLLKSASGAQGYQVPVRLEQPAAGQSARRILVVDDSITSRTLLKTVLESYGYQVKTACDGFDALTVLQEGEPFDLATLDVEMPRMTGFELTARIRANERFARLPVVLVTSLDSADDRKKGVDAGADAYIVKSSFDQSNLLDIIRKLI